MILIWVVCGVAAAFIAENRGTNGFPWFLLGVNIRSARPDVRLRLGRQPRVSRLLQESPPGGSQMPLLPIGHSTTL